MALNTAVAITTGSIAAASSPTTPIMAILITMKMQPESTVVTNVPTKGIIFFAGVFMPAFTMSAITTAATPSAAKSINGDVVVI